MQKIKLKTEESGKKLLEAYAPPKWSETADDDDDRLLDKDCYAFYIVSSNFGKHHADFKIVRTITTCLNLRQKPSVLQTKTK